MKNITKRIPTQHNNYTNTSNSNNNNNKQIILHEHPSTKTITNTITDTTMANNNNKNSKRYRQLISKQLYKIYQTSTNTNSLHQSIKYYPCPCPQHKQNKQTKVYNRKHKYNSSKQIKYNNNNSAQLQQIPKYQVLQNNYIQQQLKSYRYKSIQCNHTTNKHKNKYDPYLQQIKPSIKLRKNTSKNILKISKQTINKQNYRNSVNSINSARSIYSHTSNSKCMDDKQIYSHRALVHNNGKYCNTNTNVNASVSKNVKKNIKNTNNTKKTRRFLTQLSAHKNNQIVQMYNSKQNKRQYKKQSKQQKQRQRQPIIEKYKIQTNKDKQLKKQQQNRQNQQISSILYENNDITKNNMNSVDNSSIMHNIIDLEMLLGNCDVSRNQDNRESKQSYRQFNKLTYDKQNRPIQQINYHKKQKCSLLSLQLIKPSKLRKYNKNIKNNINFIDNKHIYKTINNQYLQKQTTNHTQYEQNKQQHRQLQLLTNRQYKQKIPSHIQSLPSLQSIQSLVSYGSQNMKSYRKKGKLNKNNPLIMKSIEKIRHNFPRGFFNQTLADHVYEV